MLRKREKVKNEHGLNTKVIDQYKQSNWSVFDLIKTTIQDLIVKQIYNWNIYNTVWSRGNLRKLYLIGTDEFLKEKRELKEQKAIYEAMHGCQGRKDGL